MSYVSPRSFFGGRKTLEKDLGIDMIGAVVPGSQGWVAGGRFGPVMKNVFKFKKP